MPPPPKPILCPVNEAVNECGGCEPSCFEPHPFCIKICQQLNKCECQENFYRHNGTNACVPAQQCPEGSPARTQTPPVAPSLPPFNPNGTTSQCKKNERLNQCSGCESQCGQPQIACKMMCNNIPKCECDFGFFRNNQTGECVDEKECPNGGSGGQQCGENELLKSCPGCEPTCENQNPICPAICRLGQACQCQPGFVRNSQKKCVKPAQCSSTGNNTQCGENEILNQCSGCEATCGNLNRVCNMMCNMIPKCECAAGFARDSSTNKCVPTAQCSSSSNSTQCKENETLKSCPGCEPTCNNPNPVCIEMCREGQACECSTGFVRNEAGKCVKQFQCSPSTGNNTQCGENERLNQCSGCEATCGMLDRMCPMMCNMIPKCECASGFARDPSTNKCVPTAQCSGSSRPPRDNETQSNNGQCKENEVLTSCPGCEPTCEQRTPICTQACRLGQECQCLKGFYRNSQGKCVSAAQCDSPSNNNSSTSCPKNEIFMDCGGCEGSCTDHNPMCTLQCRPAGCYCPVGKGFVRGPKGKCIHRSMCKKRGIRATEAPTEEEYNPCAATTCMVGSVCEPISGSNPPQARCVAPSEPSCDMECPAGEKCVLQEVQCIRAPCPPQPTCEKVNGTQPGLDKCALILCTADSRCVDGQCLPIDPRPTRSTPENDRCALMRCMSGTRCINGQCVPNQDPSFDPCAAITCPTNTTCEKVQVNCIQAPCPPEGRCVPLNQTSSELPIDEPQLTCETVDCRPGYVCRMKVVFCIRAPCPPMPECVPQTEDLQISDPCATIDCASGFRCETFRQNCVMAPCPVVPVEGRCVPINE